MPRTIDTHTANRWRSSIGDAERQGANQDRLDDGPVEALSAYYSTHSKELRKYAYKLVHNPDLAEDVVQQAFTSTLEVIEEGTPIGSYSAYLHRCIRNLAVDQLRKDPIAALHEADHMSNTTTSMEIVDIQERWRTVERAINTLPEHLRTALLLAELRGLNYKEIAVALDRSIGSVRQILRRARNHVREIAGPQKVPMVGPLLGLHTQAPDAGSSRSSRRYLAERLDAVHNWLVAIAGRGGESLAAPATSLIAALVVTALSGAPAVQRDAVPPSSHNGPLAISLPTDPGAVKEAMLPPSPDEPPAERRRVNDGSPTSGASKTEPAKQTDSNPSGQKPARVAAASNSSTSDEPPEGAQLQAQASPDSSNQPGSGWASTGYDGSLPNSSSEEPAVSAGGGNVAFTSAASNLVPGDTNGVRDVFVRNAFAKSAYLVSVGLSGKPANGPSGQPAISAKAPLVAFSSKATNLVLGDTNGVRDIFVRNSETGMTKRASVSSGGEQANGVSVDPTVSADGRYIAFTSTATNLLDEDPPERPKGPEIVPDGDDSLSDNTPTDSNGHPDVFVHDLRTGTTERISLSPIGEETDGPSAEPSISADGRFVAFTSQATNLVVDDENGLPDVFVYDRWRKSTQRISIGAADESANGASGEPAISADGRHVAFSSTATNIAPGDTGGLSQVYVHDRQTRESIRVSAGVGNQSDTGESKADIVGGAPTDPVELFTDVNSRKPSISADGRYVAFESVEHEIDPTRVGKPSLGQVFVRDMGAERIRLASENASGNRWASVSPAIDPLGSALVYVVHADLTETGFNFIGEAIYVQRLAD